MSDSDSDNIINSGAERAGIAFAQMRDSFNTGIQQASGSDDGNETADAGSAPAGPQSPQNQGQQQGSNWISFFKELFNPASAGLDWGGRFAAAISKVFDIDLSSVFGGASGSTQFAQNDQDLTRQGGDDVNSGPGGSAMG